MLPEAKNYLIKGGLKPGPASYATIGVFLGGVLGIQLVSRIMHHYIPSHIVDCDHSHDDFHEHHGTTEEDVEDDHVRHALSKRGLQRRNTLTGEDTALLPPADDGQENTNHDRPQTYRKPSGSNWSSHRNRGPSSHRHVASRIAALMSGERASCTNMTKCGGYGEPCISACIWAKSRSPTGFSCRRQQINGWDRPPMQRTSTAPPSLPLDCETLEGLLEETNGSEDQPATSPDDNTRRGRHNHSHNVHRKSYLDTRTGHKRSGSESTKGDPESGQPDHHHHVPTNAFLAIGLQTSMAIALHKLPEGFITYATNHANPKLGFSVFMALFIHNITEGFAMALPLYLALQSRPKAMFWSSLLGGVSQPLGAGIAAIWFKAAGSRGMAPGELVYGCMFAVTSGVMASVALQLFQESMTMTHDRNLCTLFAFVGMGILGFSFALTAS